MAGRPLTLLLALALLVPGANRSAVAGQPADMNQLAIMALAANPDLKAAETRWHMFEKKIVPASALDDPRLSLSLANYPTDTFSWDQTPMSGEIFRLSQALPFPGKLAAKGRVAEQQALWYRGVYEDARLQLVRQVKEAWYMLSVQERVIERTGASLGLMDDVIRLARIRYETGRGSQQEVLRAGLERSVLYEKLLSARQQRETALAALNALLYRPAAEAIDIPASIDPLPLDRSAADLLQAATRNRPMVRAYQALAGQYEAQKELARLDFYPDFFAGAAYTVRQQNPADDGTDFASLELGMTLPLNRERRREAAAEAALARELAARQLDDFLNKTRLAIADNQAQMRRAEELVLLYRTGILPQARQSLQAALAGYQAGKAGFQPLLDATLALHRYEIEHQRALADYGRAIARLEAEAGLGMPESHD